MSTIKDAIKYRIRLADVQDAVAIATLGKQTFIETFGEQNTAEDIEMYVSSQFTTEVISSEISDPTNCFFLILDVDNNIMGYAKMRKTDATKYGISKNAIELQRIYILREHHGKRAGAILMQACLDQARHDGFQVIWLGVWEHNTKALAFYKKLGFEEFGSHNFQLGSDVQTDLLMKKKL